MLKYDDDDDDDDDLNFVLLVLQHKHSATLLRFEP